MKDLIKEVNSYLANLGVMYFKLHNLHWNVVGPQFKTVHEYIETIYDGFAESLDEVAEYIKMENEFPIVKMKDYLELSTINEIDSEDYFTLTVMKILYDDFSTLLEQASKIRMYADKTDKFSLVNILDNHISEYKKTIWFLCSSLK